MKVKTLPRRTFLRGVGAVMGLPLLEAMLPARARAAHDLVAAQPPQRMAFVFFPNGAIMDAWRPSGTGAGYSLGETMASLQPLRSEITVISGLAQDNGRAKGDGPGDHARCAASFLTGVHPFKTAGADIRCGVSVDQAAAQRVGHATPLPSLELGIERGQNAGNCDSGYSCAYSSNISWKSAAMPMAKETHPRLVFERLFGQQLAPPDRARRNRYRRSILDLVSADARRLRPALGQADRRKLDEYLDSVRQLELRLMRVEAPAEEAPPELALPEGIPADLGEHVQLMFDLMLLAFRTDTTRIATFMLGNAGSNRSYPMVNVSDGHHQLSHHQNDAEKMARIQRIDAWLVSQFAAFLQRLKDTSEGEDGSLLDHCMVLYGSGISDGNRHRHDDLPLILAGRGGHTLRVGQHLQLPRETPLNNLYLSLLDRMGAGIDSMGDSSGRLVEIDM